MENGNLSPIFGPILERNRDSDWVRGIYATWGFKTTQKIYNYVHKIDTPPKCPICHSPLKFLSYNKGYAEFCGGSKCTNGPRKRGRPRKEQKPDDGFPQTEDIDTSDITDGKPKVISQTRDYQTEECVSDIITTLKDTDESKLLKEHGFNDKEWRIIKVRHSIWQQNSKKDGVKDLYASQIHVLPRVDKGYSEEEIIERLERVSGYKPNTKQLWSIKPTKKGSCVLLLPICDLHYGLLATNPVTGNEYNVEIAKRRFNQFIAEAVAQARATKSDISEIIFTLGNDFYNADTLAGTTVKGTPQDQQDHLTNLAESATQMVMDSIEFLKGIAPVTVLAVKANHDWTASYYMMLAVYHKYKNDPKVTPILSRQARVYLQYGENLFGFAHDQKMPDTAKLMATEAAEQWSRTKFRTFFLAHLHHEIVDEIGSVVVRRLPTLSGHSTWSNDQGFVGSTARSQAFIFSEDRGLTYIINVEVD